ncbi:sperm-associated antigen 7 homolog isoform X2 [Salmo trutta]|uniref:sperm-associated antigen 7 homolog isoform X2 n=1 Tax=Salmo trutta TaxID=8032 RepID=UPI001131EAEB|nr:sperm-associated antigen 7 homolog isoform X2 [Salmo trutta]
MADLLGSILKSAEKPPTVGDKETRRRDREQAARRKKMQQDEKKKKAEFRKRMEKEVSEFIQDSKQQKRKYNSTGKIERSILSLLHQTMSWRLTRKEWSGTPRKLITGADCKTFTEELN